MWVVSILCQGSEGIKKEDENWTLAVGSLCFLTVNAMWAATSSSCHYTLPTVIDYTLFVGTKTNSSPLGFFLQNFNAATRSVITTEIISILRPVMLRCFGPIFWPELTDTHVTHWIWKTLWVQAQGSDSNAAFLCCPLDWAWTGAMTGFAWFAVTVSVSSITWPSASTGENPALMQGEWAHRWLCEWMAI